MFFANTFTLLDSHLYIVVSFYKTVRNDLWAPSCYHGSGVHKGSATMKRITKIGIILLIVTVGFTAILSILYDGDFEMFIEDIKGDIGPSVYANKMAEKPSNYLEINESELEKYPYVKKAVMNPDTDRRIPISDNTTTEFTKMLFEHNRTDYIKFNQEYYHISVLYAP